MSQGSSHATETFADYLDAKATVDERALNTDVFRALVERALCSERPDGTPLSVVELGAGIGTMAERLARSGAPGRGTYLLMDLSPDLLDEARRRLEGVGAGAWEFAFHEAELGAFLADVERQGRHDLVLAHAFLDLFDIDAVLPRIGGLLKPRGIGWFTINFNGSTRFFPAEPGGREDVVWDLYHGTMNHALSDGAVRDGRYSGWKLLQACLAQGWEVLAWGPSDWTVRPENGLYPAREGRFLEHMVRFVEGALAGHPQLSTQALEEWAADRRARIAQGQLHFHANNLDVLARRPD